ncbi:MAG: thioredoxin [Planctomycetota bacterium]|jgi:thioredoxin 1
MICRARMHLVLALLALFALTGCSAGPTSGMSLETAPDGDIEILTIDKNGDIAHQPGRFLQAVRRSDSKFVIVDCWASWCGPCRALAPILEDIKRERGDEIEVVKVDVDANPEIARFLNASAIPDVRIYREGVQVYDFVGLMPKGEIDSILKSLK